MGIQLSARIAVMESDEGPMVCLRKDPRRAPYRQGAGPDEKSIKKVAAPHKCRQKLSCCLHFFFRIPSFSVIIKVGDAHGGFFYHQIDFFRSLGFFSVKVSQHSTGCFL